MTPAPSTIVAAFAAMTSADATRPLITYYDDGTGERLDLSGATLGNWVAKTANLLVDGHGLGTGDVATVRLPPHWLSAAVLLGCWSAGLAVGSGTADVGFTTAHEPVDAADVYALSLAPLGAPFRPGPPPATLDYVMEVRQYGDHFTPRILPTDRALADGTTHGSLLTPPAAAVAGHRVLIDAARTPDPRSWLVSPLGAGCTIVLCANLDPARLDARLSAERAVFWG